MWGYGVIAPEVETQEVVEVEGRCFPVFVGGGRVEDGKPEGCWGVGVIPGYYSLQHGQY